MKKTIQINPDLFKVTKKERLPKKERNNNVSSLKKKLFSAGTTTTTTANTTSVNPLKDAVNFFAKKNKWVDVKLDTPFELLANPVATVAPSTTVTTTAVTAPPQTTAVTAPPTTVALQTPAVTAVAVAPSTLEPSYGCLKAGTKPTYRSWLRETQKRKMEIDTNAMPIQDIKLNEKLDNELAVIDELKPTHNSLVKKKIKTKTLKKHVIGKNEDKRVITVLLKDAEKKKEVIAAKQDLKNTSMDVIKKYLYDHNLVKKGSHAPNNVLVNIFKNARLTGEVFNNDVTTMMTNFLK
jgi:hypothetical protein